MAKFTQMDAVREIQEQLSSDKRKLGFCMGAGTSMAVDLPGIDALTSQVYSKLDPAKVCVGGIVENWEPIASEGKEDEISKYWDGHNFTV